MSVWTADGVEAARKAGWDAVLDPDDLFRSPGWLELESEQTNLAPVYYLAGTDDGTAEAGLSCYPLDSASEPWPFMRVDRTLRMLADRHGVEVGREAEAALDALLPTYLCGGRRVPNTAVPSAPGLGADRRRQRVGELVAAVEADARDGGVASVGFLFAGAGDTALRETLRARGYLEFSTANYSTMRLPGPGFDAYLELIAPDRRRKVRYERRQLEAAGLRFTVEPLTGPLMAQLVPLLLQHGGKYGHRYTAEGMTRNLELHARHCGEAAEVIAARDADGVLRGFSLVVRRGERLYVRQTGYDYDWLGKLPLYFALCFYEPVEHAGRTGATTLDYAVATEQAKVSRGCVLEERLGYLKAFDPRTHESAAGLLRLLGQPA